MSRANYGNGAVYRRGRTWWIQFSHRGRRYRESSQSERRGDAVRLLRVRLAELGQGRVPIVDGRVSFNRLVDLLERDYRLKGRRSLKRAQEAVVHLRAAFGQLDAEEITEARFPEYQEGRQGAGASPATARYELCILRRMFSLAARQRLVRSVPVFDLPTPKNARKGFLTAGHMAGLLPKLPEALRPVFAFAYYTGWRIPSEVLTLQWSQVDLAAGEVRLDPATTKNDEPRVFPFAQAAALDTLLHQQRKAADVIEADRGVQVPWVFHRNGRRIKDCRGAWEKACEAAGLAGRLMHDLRRSAVRNLVNAGVPELTAMKLTGHKTRAVFDRYNIVSPAETAGAVAKLSAYLAGLECHNTATPGARPEVVPAPVELRKAQ